MIPDTHRRSFDSRKCSRRDCLRLAPALALGGLGGFGVGLVANRTSLPFRVRSNDFSGSLASPTHSIIPVVGDGRWIWREPPPDQTGYLEPRLFEVRVGVDATAKFPATDFVATTPAPTTHPEQEVVDVHYEKTGCVARVQSLSPEASQLVVSAARIDAGQTIRGEAVFKLRVSKSYFGYSLQHFPAVQKIPRPIAKPYLSDSPGIETRLSRLAKLVAEITRTSDHPWDKARTFHQWVFDNIRGVPGDYTSVKRALETGQGDCEERAGVFIALCRAAGIPARLVWVPNHVWAEFLLFDQRHQPHWIPAHTAAYSWFGWTGAHEIVLQKGDRIRQPGPDKSVRLLLDWWRCGGAKPSVRFFASVTPLGDPQNPQSDPGPGAREKQPDGKWRLVGQHFDNKLLRA